MEPQRHQTRPHPPAAWRPESQRRCPRAQGAQPRTRRASPRPIGRLQRGAGLRRPLPGVQRPPSVCRLRWTALARPRRHLGQVRRSRARSQSWPPPPRGPWPNVSGAAHRRGGRLRPACVGRAGRSGGPVVGAPPGIPQGAARRAAAGAAGGGLALALSTPTATLTRSKGAQGARCGVRLPRLQPRRLLCMRHHPLRPCQPHRVAQLRPR
mmetsp:Transcript_28404/g.90426  ORF Transcript_28404/g.90426 Transcript_28404/m.90426 type:complete len:210 (+) Transcript_28404:594-1223(+)